LVNRKGEVAARFAPTKTPSAIEKHIAKLVLEK
jgi:glutathione peroxidase-family protein